MTNRKLIKAFKQGGTGNCVSIAIIKAGIEIFGLNNIFNHYWKDDNCYVIMRDGKELSFSKSELNKATKKSKFILLKDKSVFNYANLCFAAMAKRAQMEDNDGNENMSFSEAIRSLNTGEYYLEGPHWIGLRHHIRSIGRKHIWQYKGVIGASKKHCFFASKGLEDDYGRINKINLTERLFCKWFRISEKAIF
ncbi:hypothetical protein [Aureispira anguillae]|uniref:Uncharacterized protein n=1 Tax=Aureispira anguillae TaxID=2864201 RepID=A0A916DWI0_9BACT|nr:hypothetical protein [Aureispira anguillae]BDS14710.1 hypothetical protein AsAng_0054910 [Aureispira anguillae]